MEKYFLLNFANLWLENNFNLKQNDNLFIRTVKIYKICIHVTTYTRWISDKLCDLMNSAQEIKMFSLLI